MNHHSNALFIRASQPEAIAQTEEYLAGHLSNLLKRHETVLVCFPNEQPDSLGTLFCNAVRQTGAVALCCHPDYRWKTILRLSLQRRATAIVAPPAVALGLAKAARATNTPISIRTVILAGYPSTPWIIEGIGKWLDCTVHGCYTPGCGSVVAGFSCKSDASLHLRSDCYTAERDPETQEIILRAREDPDAWFATGETGILTEETCACGLPGTRLQELRPCFEGNFRFQKMDDLLLTWSSILDYRAIQTEFGVDLQVVVFPGEKLPHLPSCAKLSLRSWEPEKDVPFFYQYEFSPPHFPRKTVDILTDCGKIFPIRKMRCGNQAGLPASSERGTV